MGEGSSRELQDRWVEEVLGLKMSTAATPSKGPGLEEALKEWLSQRDQVVSQLLQLGKAISAANDPEAEQAEILLQGIGKNLTKRPDDARKVKELEDYLVAEDLIDEAEAPNGFGITVSIRAALTPALGRVKAAIGGPRP